MFKQGDIIAVRYPFSDDPGKSKLRPAVIISNERSNDLDQDFIISPITTTLRDTPFSFVLNEKDLISPLPRNSEVRCNKFATIRQNLIVAKISGINAESLSTLLNMVKSVF